MTAVDTRNALRELSDALEKAELPGVELVMYPEHLTVIAETGDFAIWVSPWGRPVLYKLEGVNDSHRCGSAKNAVETLRKLTTP